MDIHTSEKTEIPEPSDTDRFSKQPVENASCCSATKHATCCAPDEKAGCCDTSKSVTCCCQ